MIDSTMPRVLHQHLPGVNVPCPCCPHLSRLLPQQRFSQPDAELGRVGKARQATRLTPRISVGGVSRFSSRGAHFSLALPRRCGLSSIVTTSPSAPTARTSQAKL